MIKIVVLLLALLLSGCSHTTVHLYSRYLTEQQVEQISQSLQAQDYVVKTNQLAFPDSVTQSSLIYSPFMQDIEAVNNLISLLNNQEWPIHHSSMLFADNHWYKENSIALMLLPEGVDPQQNNQNQDWAKEFKSEHCQTDMSISLAVSGQYKIIDANNKLIKNERAQGQWDISQFPYVTFNAAELEWPFYFEAKTYKKQDLIGEVQIYELAPMSNYSFLNNCTFMFGQRV